jgi:hypothetical protein
LPAVASSKYPLFLVLGLFGTRALPKGNLGRNILIKCYLIQIEEARNEHRIQIGRVLGKRPLGRLGRGCKISGKDI